MNRECLHTLMVSLYCTLMLTSAGLKPEKPASLAAMVGLGQGIETEISAELAKMGVMGIEFSAPPAAVTPVEVLAEGPQAGEKEGALTALAKKIMAGTEEDAISGYFAKLLGLSVEGKEIVTKTWFVTDKAGTRVCDAWKQGGEIKFFIMVQSKDDAMMFLSNSDGVLEKAVYAKAGKGGSLVVPAQNNTNEAKAAEKLAREKFEKEKEFWLKELSSRSK